METVLGLLLIRFAVIVAIAVVLGLVVFAVVVALHRRGRADRARAGAATLARLAARAVDERDRARGGAGRSIGGGITRGIAARLGDGSRGDR